MSQIGLIASALLTFPQVAAAEVCDKEVGYGEFSSFETACEQFSRSPTGKAWRGADQSDGWRITVFEREVLFTSVGGSTQCTACVATCRVMASDAEDENGPVLFDTPFVTDEYSVDWYKCWIPSSWSARWTKVMQ